MPEHKTQHRKTDDDGLNESVVDASSDSENDDDEENRDAISDDNGRGERDRFDVLTKKLVSDYKAEKNQRDDDSLDDGQITHSSTPGLVKGADTAAKWLGYGSAGVGAVSAVGGPLAELAADNIPALGEGETINGDTLKTANSYVSLVGQGMGAVGSGLKTAANSYKAVKSKNKNARKTARYKAVSGALGVLGNVGGAAGTVGGLGAFGDSSEAMQASVGLGMAGSALGFGAGILDYMGNLSDKSGHKKTADAAKAFSSLENKQKANAGLKVSRNLIGKYKQKRRDELTDVEREDFKSARQMRHTAKAQKYAMAQAAKMHKDRSDESASGIFGLLGSGAGFLGSALKGVSKLGGFGGFGKALGAIGSVLGGIGAIAKVGGIAADKHKEADKAKSRARSRKDVVEEYLNEKAAKIMRQAGTMQLDEEEMQALGRKGKSLSEKEAKKIALMRLGANITYKDDEIPQDAYDFAFTVLTEKRARNILNSSADEKAKMLNALGLDADASFEDVVSSLKGD